eukprot:204836-Chlamydomonas_euryale.AAC.1
MHRCRAAHAAPHDQAVERCHGTCSCVCGGETCGGRLGRMWDPRPLISLALHVFCLGPRLAAVPQCMEETIRLAEAELSRVCV